MLVLELPYHLVFRFGRFLLFVLLFLPFGVCLKSFGGTFSDEVLSHSEMGGSCSTLIIVVVLCLLRLGRGLRLNLKLSARLFFRFVQVLLLDRVFGLDDGQIQIEQEKGAKEYQGNEEEDDEWRVGLLIHDHDI